ncbi:uncharacterized protein [Lolium perenne]|uniref:uncharacterized protein n=1 Tax=Lolium perenne TaxID=4522 RepID=UPI003A9969D9
MRTAVGREANRRGPAVSSPFPFSFISATAALSSSSPHSPLPCAQSSSPPCSPPLFVFRRSFVPVARRTHACVPPDFAARRSSAATPPSPPHSPFLKHFFASPPTDFLAGRRLAVSPANFFPRNSAAPAAGCFPSSGVLTRSVRCTAPVILLRSPAWLPSKEDVVLKASQICQTDMPDDWEWGLCPLSARNPPSEDAKARFPRIDSDRRGPRQKRPLDKYDPDPVIHWLDLRMGRTPASRLGKSPPEPADLPSASNKPQVHEHVPPLQAEVGDEFLGKLMAEGQKSDPPAADAGPSHASSGKRPRTEVIGGKQVGTKRYKQKRTPMSSG